ncbi:ABC-2 family transporter protein [Corynebacterium felinum]|nr:ABC-2 family transporter protein [Corynebacterium felinum]
MIDLLVTEVVKTKKLRLYILSLSIALVIAILSTFSLLSGSIPIDNLSTPFAWHSVLLSITFFGALVWPVFTAVVASKQVENEFDHKGWFLLAMSGISPLRAVNAKVIVAIGYLVLAATTQLVCAIVIGKICGITAPIGSEWWLYYSAILIVGIVFYLFSCVVAIASKNQVFTIVFGMINSFLAAAFMLVSLPLSYLFPWAYFAYTSPVRMVDGSVVLVQTNWMHVFFFVLFSFFIAYILILKFVKEV